MNCHAGCQCNSSGDTAVGSKFGSCSDISQTDCAGTVKGIALAQLGQMLDYPDGQFFSKLDRLAASVIRAFPITAKLLKKFQDLCTEMTLAELEELYTRTFDLAAIASPYITGYIYGDENFDRGTLMACLSENYARLGFDLEGELPDHLGLLLRFSSWLDEETLEELIGYCLMKPVQEMCAQLKGCDNAYFFLLSAVQAILNSAPSGESKS